MAHATGLNRKGPRERRAGAAARAFGFALLAACVGFHGGEAAAQETHAAKALELLAQAHTRAAQDDHAGAITSALAAIELDPALEDDAALLLGNQLTWSDRAPEAIAWYRVHLQSRPGDRDARLGLARAFAWSGRTDEARAAYRELVAEDPNDVEARLGLARLAHWDGDDRGAARGAREALRLDPGNGEAARLLASAENRRGRHRAAEALYDSLRAAGAADDDVLVGRARALHWMGESARARAALEDTEGAAGRGPGVELLQSIDSERTRHVEFGYARFDDVDDQELETWRAAVEASMSVATRWRVEARADAAREPGTDEVRLRRLIAGAAHRFDRAWAFQAYVGAGRVTADGAVDAGEGLVLAQDDVRRTIALADAWVTWTPVDWTRFDWGAARMPIETPKALARGIAVEAISFGARRRIHDRVALDASVSRSGYSDDNSRVAGGASIEFTPWNGAPLVFLAGASAFSFDRVVDHGYYNPESYDVVFAEARFGRDFVDRMRVDAFARLSSESEGGADRFGVGSGGIDATWNVARPFAITLFARRSTSRFDSGAGYERDGWGASIRLAP